MYILFICCNSVPVTLLSVFYEVLQIYVKTFFRKIFERTFDETMETLKSIAKKQNEDEEYQLTLPSFIENFLQRNSALLKM